MMLAFVKDHGAWFAYVPTVHPEPYSLSAMFTKRAGDSDDGAGWYAYAKSADSFQPGTVKVVVLPIDGQWIAHAATREAAALFPQGGAKVIEFDDGGTDPVPEGAYSGKVYDDVAHTLIDSTLLPMTKEALVAYANKRQWAVATGGRVLTLNGAAVGFATTPEAMTLMAGKVQRLLQPDPPTLINWQTGPTTIIPILAADFLTVSTAIADFVQATFDALPGIFGAIDDGTLTTPAQIDAVLAAI